MSRTSSRISLACCALTLLVSIPATSQSQALNGLYLQNQSIGRGDAWNYYYFWPDGHICKVMPKGGFGPSTTFAAVSRQAPTTCGTYTMGAGKLNLRIGNAAPQALDIGHFDATGFALSDFPTIRVPAYPSNTRLSGRWGALIIKGDDYRDETFTFTPDGRFTLDDGKVRTVGAPTRHIQGTYQLSGNTMQVTTPDGSQLLSIHRFPSPQDPRISIDGHVLAAK
jgi:hypothetical protein